MKGKDAKIFLESLSDLEKTKGISKENLLVAVEQSLLAAYKKNFGEEENIIVKMNRETGDVKIFEVKTVVDKKIVKDAALEISLDEAKEIKKRVKEGDTIEIEVHCEEFKRNAIQNGKQIVIQKVREAERDDVYNKFKEKEGKILNGTIRRIDERHNVHIEFDGLEAALPMSEMSLSDVYRVGERITVYVVSVERTNKFPNVVISRKHEGLLRCLFEMEIPEIQSGLIEIKAVAREAGSRAKVAVYSKDKNIDTVGACIGQKGIRIVNIVNELGGEKIDIVEWTDNIEDFVANVLSPAKVESVEIIDSGMTASVLVDQSQLSLAIGKKGQNARLAAKLTGMRVDINVLGVEKN